MTFSPDSIWSAEKVEWLKRLWATDAPFSLIAQEMGISRNSVIGKCHRLGLPSRGPAPRLSEEELRRRRNERQRKYDSKRRFNPKPKVSKKMESPSIVPPPPYIGDLKIPFADLRDYSNKSPNQCRFIADEPPGPLYLACGNETRPGEPYCSHCTPLTRANVSNSISERREHIRMGTRQYLASKRRAA